MHTTVIDPYDYFPKGHPIKVAIRVVSRKWYLCFSKLLALEWHITDDPSVPYGATDGRRLILNNAGVDVMATGPQGIEALVFLLCHEALHALLGHPWRGVKLRNKEIANIAADYIVNAMISDQGMHVIPNVYLDKSVSGDLSLEQLYRKLLNDAQPQKPNPTGNDLIEMELSEGEDEQEVIDKLAEANEALIIADAAHAKATGKTSTRCVDRGSTTDIRWQDVLQEYFCDRTHSRWIAPVNRPIYGSTKLVCLGRAKQKTGTLAVAIDTSGSVDATMLADFLAEVGNIIEQVNPESVHVISASHMVCDHVVIERGDPIPVSLNGGGGTLFQPTFDYVTKQGIDPAALIYLTDGYACDARHLRPTEYPVLWVTTGATNMNHGTVIQA
jgi:predicted metal-dependent peptidase